MVAYNYYLLRNDKTVRKGTFLQAAHMCHKNMILKSIYVDFVTKIFLIWIQMYIITNRRPIFWKSIGYKNPCNI